MVETINPVVHGGRRGGWLVDVVVHVVGATAAAAVFGAALGEAGALLGAPWGMGGALLLFSVALVYGVGELAGRRVPVPQARRQVPDWWRTFFSRPVFSFLYGAGLGIGFLTYLSRGTLVAVTVAAVASGRPLAGAFAMGAFGLARGASVLVAVRVRTVAEATALVDRLVRASTRWAWRLANAAALLAIAVMAGLAAAASWQLGVEGLAGAVLAVTFGWAAVAKLARPGSWRRALEGYQLPSSLRPVARFAVPAAEAAVGLLAVAGMHRAAGVLALALLVVFSVIVVRTRVRGGGRVPCGCFGGRRSEDVRVVLARNAVLTIAAGAAIVRGPDRLRWWLPAPNAGDVLPIALAAAGLAVGVWAVWRVSAALRPGTRA